MQQERIIWSGGINRSLDARHLQNHEQYDAVNVEVLEKGSLSKRKGFGTWRANGVIGDGDAVVRGIGLMYDSDGNRYLFVCFDGASGTDLWIEKNHVKLPVITSFFPTSGYRVRMAVFGDRIYFVNGIDRPRWYKQHLVWGIAGVPSPARRAEDESDFDYFVSRAFYADCITSSEDLGIDPPGIWRYKQTMGYYGKESDEQIEESNAGPASPMFHCQFNMSESLSVALEGYIKKGIPIGIADFDDLILDANESGGQDYEDEIRWMRMHRQVKMFSDELYSPFEFLVEMRKGWPTSISDVYNRDSAIVAPTTRVSIPVSHHITNANNRLFLGRVEKELFTQPGLPANFRGETTYKPNFSYRMPITIQNTNPKTLTSAIIPLRFQDVEIAKHVATPPSGGGDWYGAYIDTSLDLSGLSDWFQMIFVDEDGVTPLGFTMIAQNSKSVDDITFLVEIPEMAAGGSRTIYLYFEDSQLSNSPASYPGEPGHWKSLAHYPLLSSDHLLLIDFENWDTGMAMTDITQKRSLAYVEQGPAALGAGVANIAKSVLKRFFNRGADANMGASPSLNVAGNVAPGSVECVQVKFYPPADSANVLSFAFFVLLSGSSGHSGSVRLANPASAEDEISILVNFADGTDNTFDITATAYGTDSGDSTTAAINVDNSEYYYIAVVVTLDKLTLYVVQGDHAGHPGETSSWDTSGWVKESEEVAFSGPVKMYSSVEAFIATGGDVTDAENRFGEIQVMTRELDGLDELIHFWMWDTYFPNHGLATAGDRESQTGEKHPDRFYFSKLNQPNSFEAVDFRDMGELGKPIQGIKSIRNRLFVFDENKIRALFSAGAEQALTLTSGDTTMWNLSQDLTGELGGLGVLAPDTLVSMEFAGIDGLGFLSGRGFYFFDGNRFTHISEKVGELIRDDIGNYGKDFVALFIKKKRQLLIIPPDIQGLNGKLHVANMKFATNVDSIVWTDFGNMAMRFGVELDEYIDGGDFVFIYFKSFGGDEFQILKLEGNTGDDTYVDIAHSNINSVRCEVKSRYFDLRDAEMLKVAIENEIATPSSNYEVELFSDVSGSMALVKTFTNPANGEKRCPIGTHARTFMVRITDITYSAVILRTIDLYFNVHGYRRLP